MPCIIWTKQLKLLFLIFLYIPLKNESNSNMNKWWQKLNFWGIYYLTMKNFATWQVLHAGSTSHNIRDKTCLIREYGPNKNITKEPFWEPILSNQTFLYRFCQTLSPFKDIFLAYSPLNRKGWASMWWGLYHPKRQSCWSIRFNADPGLKWLQVERVTLMACHGSYLTSWKLLRVSAQPYRGPSTRWSL